MSAERLVEYVSIRVKPWTLTFPGGQARELRVQVRVDDRYYESHSVFPVDDAESVLERLLECAVQRVLKEIRSTKT